MAKNTHFPAFRVSGQLILLAAPAVIKKLLVCYHSIIDATDTRLLKRKNSLMRIFPLTQTFW